MTQASGGALADGARVLVIGGGIAGLAAAAALARRGASVEVLERAPDIAEVGAGLQISPNGAVVIDALGAGAALRQVATRGQAVVLCDGPGGVRVTRLDLAALRPGQGYYFVHRADLIALLLDAARSAGAWVESGAEVVSVVPAADGAGPRVVLADGTWRDAGHVIGAEGLHSATRTLLNGRSVPFFTHQVAWRALIPAEPGAAPEAEVFMGPGRHLVSYPLRGGRLRNIVAVEERHRWAAEGWHHRDDPAALRAAFAGFSAPVRRWLDAVDTVNLWGLFRHDVAPVWARDGIAILGDAAHPTLPFLAQGANMALEDAWSLAAALDAPGGDTALTAWAAARRARTARIVEAANRNARAYHLRGPVRHLAHAGLRLGGRVAPGAALGRFAWIYDHDVTATG